jgi:hypothetical protein
MSLSNCFNKGAKTATEVSIPVGLINVSRGGGYEFDDYT